MSRFPISVLLLACTVLVCFVGAEPAAAQITCSAFHGVSGPFGYRKMADSERCEGLYQEQVSGNLDFLSLVSGRINYDLVSDQNLIVSVPALPQQFAGAPVFLMARSLPRGTPYRMDAMIQAGGKFRWPLSPMLKQVPLQADSIGVVAWIDQPIGKYYMPVSVTVENVAPSAGQPPTMIVRPPLDLVLLRWRVRRDSGGAGPGDYVNFGGEHPAIIGAGQPVKLEIRDQPNGPSIVDLAAYYVNRGRPDSQLIRVILP